jgi:hypothetical protein
MPHRDVTVGGGHALALREGELEVVVVPEDGARLARLHRAGGREWLRGGGVRGGWTDTLRAATPDLLAAPAALHDLLAVSPWETEVREGAGQLLCSSRATVQAPGGAVLELQRDVGLAADAAVVRLSYELRHLDGPAVLWRWAPQCDWLVQAGTTLHVPGLTQVRIAAVLQREDLAAGDLVAYPGAIGGDAAKLTVPAALPWALTCHGDLGAAGRLSLVDPRRGERLELRADPAAVPHVEVTLAPGAEGEVPVLRAAPCTGMPSTLAEAAALGTAATLAPGERRQWTLYLRPADPDRDATVGDD